MITTGEDRESDTYPGIQREEQIDFLYTMPNSKINRKPPADHKTTTRKLGGNNHKLLVLAAEKASSFHGRIPMAAKDLRRPKTLPNLRTEKTGGGSAPPKLSKLLLNVTIQGSVGAVQVVMSPENTVGDLIDAALRQYSKEGRRPVLATSGVDLHYSQFSLESLHRDEKLIQLGSRNFFLCPKKPLGDGTASCSKQVEKISKTGTPWLKFMDFLF